MVGPEQGHALLPLSAPLRRHRGKGLVAGVATAPSALDALFLVAAVGEGHGSGLTTRLREHSQVGTPAYSRTWVHPRRACFAWDGVMAGKWSGRHVVALRSPETAA